MTGKVFVLKQATRISTIWVVEITRMDNLVSVAPGLGYWTTGSNPDFLLKNIKYSRRSLLASRSMSFYLF